jgi:hypothetical protein
VFTNKDENLTRSHVKWLELKVWELLSQNEGKVTVANKAKPTGSKLPEAETASMITFLKNMVYVLEALGFEFFISRVPVEAATGKLVAPPTEIADKFFTNALPKTDSAKAYLDAVDGSYVLRKGSLISKVFTESLPANVRKLRDQLLGEGALADNGNCLRLEKDITFAKPSPASALVKGRSSTGMGDWLRIGDKKRLGDVLLGA